MPARAQGKDSDRFELHCEVAASTPSHSGRRVEAKIIKIDLGQKQYTVGDGAPETMAMVTPTELILQSGVTREGNPYRWTINRNTGEYLFAIEAKSIGSGMVVTGTCTRRQSSD